MHSHKIYFTRQTFFCKYTLYGLYLPVKRLIFKYVLRIFPYSELPENLAHPVHHLELSSQAEDEEIYKKAIQEKRFVLTINFKNFKRLVKKGQSGVLAIESQLSNAEIDEIVTNFVSTKNLDDYIGKVIKI